MAIWLSGLKDVNSKRLMVKNKNDITLLVMSNIKNNLNKIFFYFKGLFGHSQEVRKFKSRHAFLGGGFKAELVFGHE